MMTHTHTHNQRRRAIPIAVPSLNSIRCFLSTPGALLAFIMLTIVFLYLLSHPLFTPMVTVVHALSVDVAADAGAHPYAGVLVGRADDLAEVASWTSLSHHHQLPVRQQQPNQPSATKTAQKPFTCYGVHAQRGRRAYMEDTHSVYLNHQLHYSSANQRHLMSVDTEEGEADIVSPWALFGVYDGHGGALASEYVASYLLPVLHSSLLHHGHTGATPLSDLSSLASSSLSVRECIEDAFRSLDEEFIERIARPTQKEDGTTALVAGVYYRGATDSPQRVDAPLGRDVGTNREFQLVVANLGDCRAIRIQTSTHPPALPANTAPNDGPSDASLFPPSGAPAITALSIDHKPHAPSERSYIESQPGGFITTSRRGMTRVQGVLAVSRAIGDYMLKPYVQNLPDVRIIDLDGPSDATSRSTSCDADSSASLACPFAPAARMQCDAHPIASRSSDLLLLASDGFWDTFNNDEAAEEIERFFATRAHDEATKDHAPTHPIYSSLASHLTKEAYLRGSMDNITVMVIDLECIQAWLRQTMRGERQKAGQANCSGGEKS